MPTPIPLTPQYALDITWGESARSDMPSLPGPFGSREEAEDWAALNVPNGSWEVRPLTYPYMRSPARTGPTTSVHGLIEEAELHGDRHVPLDGLRTAVAHDTRTRHEADDTSRAALAQAIRNHRPRCDMHGIPDCSAMLNGCTRVNAMVVERDRLADLVTGLEALSA